MSFLFFAVVAAYSESLKAFRASSGKTGERYLPKAARESLSDSEYAATTAKKRKDTAAGKQHSTQPKKIADKTADYRDKYAKGGKADPRLKRAGVSGYNKPKRTPSHATKSHVVVAKSGSTIKTIRFGQQGVSGAGKNPTSKRDKARRKSFKARHAKNIAKGVLSAAYWANKVKW